MSENLLFPSEKWFNELCNLLNNSPEYKKAAAKWEGSLALVLEAEEGKLDEDFIFYAKPYHGEIKENCTIKKLDEKNPDFIIRGPFSSWQEVQQGKMDALQAIMKGKLKVKGSMAMLLKQVRASQILMQLMREIPTKFPE